MPRPPDSPVPAAADRRARRGARVRRRAILDVMEDAAVRYDAVVLAGGAARRLGGEDKPALNLGGATLLDRVLAACRDASSTVVVGPRRPTARPVVWAREDPPGGGPLPALAAALARVNEDVVVVLAADLPFVAPRTVSGLLERLAEAAAGAGGTAGTSGGAGTDSTRGTGGTDRTPGAGQPEQPGKTEEGTSGAGRGQDTTGAGRPGRGTAGTGEADGVVVVDASGRDQPLLAAYRTESLRRGLALAVAGHGSLAGLPLRLLTAGLALLRAPDTAGSAFDCDTWDDVETARARLAGGPEVRERARIGEHRAVLDEWIAAVRAELGIDLDVDVNALLDLARDAAHGVARPAAPLTTFLVGYAAAGAGGGPGAVAEAVRKARALALSWPGRDEPGAPGRWDGPDGPGDPEDPGGSESGGR